MDEEDVQSEFDDLANAWREFWLTVAYELKLDRIVDDEDLDE